MFGEREQIRTNGYEEPARRKQRVCQNDHSTRPVFDTVQMARRASQRSKAKSGAAGRSQKASVKKSTADPVKLDKILKIRRLCRKHKWEVDDAEASHYLHMIEMGLQPQIRNHNKIIIPVKDYFRISKRKLNGTGAMGRTLDQGGTDAVINHDASPYQPPEQYTSEAVINHRSITGLRKRASLNTVMKGSAYDHTGIVSSEYLHRIAHSLGGSDTPDNLTPGYHALNTAMIPIENFVRNLADKGLDVTYRVQFFPRVGDAIWVSDAHITVKFKWEGKDREYEWHIALNSQEYLSKKSYRKIEDDISEIKKALGL